MSRRKELTQEQILEAHPRLASLLEVVDSHYEVPPVPGNAQFMAISDAIELGRIRVDPSWSDYAFGIPPATNDQSRRILLEERIEQRRTGVWGYFAEYRFAEAVIDRALSHLVDTRLSKHVLDILHDRYVRPGLDAAGELGSFPQTPLP